MEIGCHSQRHLLLGRCGALGLVAVLLLSACSSSPEPPATADAQNVDPVEVSSTTSVDVGSTGPDEVSSTSTPPRGVYAPSLVQVAYVPQSTDASSEVEEDAPNEYLTTDVDPAHFGQLSSNVNDNPSSGVQLALGETRDDDDPLEGLNRYFYDMNNIVDILIFRQFAEAYRVVVPDGVKRSVTNFIRFIKTPVILANDLLQGDMDRAGNTLSRLVVNAAIGFGFFDVAADSGLPYQEQDFGQTLAVWGVDSGPYVVLPILGPSTARDGVGIGVDILLDPLTWVLPTEWGLARFGVEAIDARERNLDTLDEIRRDALDEYARVRSLWLQNRRDTIERGRIREDDDGESQESKETAALNVFESNDSDGYLVVDVDKSR